MLTTEHRPAPLPPRPAVGAAIRMPLPAGAARWSRTWVDVRGLPQVSPYEVPVDVNDRRTEHVRHVCKGFIEVDGEKVPCDQVAWLLPGAPARFCGDHGAQLEPEASRRAGVPWPQVWDVVDERVRVAGVAATVGAAGVGVGLTEQPMWALPPGVVAGIATVAGSRLLTRWWLTRQAVKRGKLDPSDEVAGKRHRRLIDKRARTAGYVAAVGAGWVGLADVVGVDPTTAGGLSMWAALAAAAVIGSRPYLRWVDSKRGIRAETIPEPEVGQPEKTSVEARAVQDAADWAATVAVSGGLPGTYVDLATWKADPGGRRMVIRNQGRRGAVTDEKIKQALPLIAGAFDVPISAVGWIAEYEGSPNAAQLFVQPNSPLNEVIPGEPIDILPVGKAIAHMGKRIDGSPLVTRLFTPGWGAPSRAIFGTKGAGKTEMLRRLLQVQLKARIETEYGPKRLVAPFMHDPKRGADYGAFRRRVCGFSIDSATLHMIVDAFGREMDRRYDALAGTVWVDEKGREREGERPFDPATTGPILSLTIDEFHIDAKDQALMAKLDPFARKMRAAGIEINIATHVATIGDTGSQGFRDMLAGGEAWLMRTTMGLNAALATGGTLNGDPRALPRVPGMVLQASGEDITMQARVAYDDGEAVYDMLYDDDNNSRIQPVDWPTETLEAFGPEFVEWMRASQERQLGSAAVSAPKGYKAAGDTPNAGEDRRAFDVLLAVLADATAPMKRSDIVNDARWPFSTKTLTNVLRAGQDSDEPMLRKVEGSNGAYELTEAGRARQGLQRERVEAMRAESAEASE